MGGEERRFGSGCGRGRKRRRKGGTRGRASRLRGTRSRGMMSREVKKWSCSIFTPK